MRKFRDNTRVQKVDARCDYDELLSLRGKLLSGKVVDEILERSVDRLYKQISDWRDRADEALIECTQQPVEPVILEKVTRLIGEGDEFNVKLPEVWKLNSVSNKVPYSILAKCLRNSSASSGFRRPIRLLTGSLAWRSAPIVTVMALRQARRPPVRRRQRTFASNAYLART